ncbi:MAG: hypothetical protein R3F42_05000 [Pseudomonadota bacterium]
MQVIIKEWPNKTASLISESGQLIWTFSTVQEARQACSDWHNLVDCEPVFVHEAPGNDPDPLPSAA